jgi:hypothetical protein
VALVDGIVLIEPMVECMRKYSGWYRIALRLNDSRCGILGINAQLDSKTE